MSRLGLKKKPAPKKPQRPRFHETPLAPATVEHKFTARQAAFMDHWMVSRNAADAARKAGFSKKAAREQGYRMLTNDHIRAELDRRVAGQRVKLEVTADSVIAEIAKIAFANMRNYMKPGMDGAPVLDFSDLTDEQGAALGSVTVEEFKDGRSDKREVRRTKFQLWDKPKALEMLGKHLKLFTEVHEHNLGEEMTLMGLMLREIDRESRQKTIEHK